MQLSQEHQTGYNLIELRILMQRAIEILDDLDLKKNPMANKPLKTQLKGIYAPLDKQTKQYNEIFEASAEGTMHFYNVVKNNAEFVMKNHLLDKALICSFLMAHERNPKAMEGIMEKILK
jgi:hypothetical protein